VFLHPGEIEENKVPKNFNLTFSVRNGKDPVFSAEVMTQNTMKLGLESKQIMAIGISLLIIPMVMCIQPIFTIYKMNLEEKEAEKFSGLFDPSQTRNKLEDEEDKPEDLDKDEEEEEEEEEDEALEAVMKRKL